MKLKVMFPQLKFWNSIKNAMTAPRGVKHNLVFPQVVNNETSLIPENIPRPDYSETILLKQRSRMKVEIKTPEQITKMKEACAIARDVLQKARSVIQPGVTTDFINETVHQEIVSRGAYPSPLKYRGFPKSCCTSVNNVVVHGIPDDRQLLDGDIINIDVTVFYDDFHGDTSDTFAVGNVDAAAKKLIRATRECLQRGIDVCGPGQTFNAIGKAIEPYANSLQFSVCRQYVGHGIGSYFHGPPNIHHYRRLKVRPGTMEPGMTFTIEPILMEGVPETRLLSDGWTVVSTDNQRSAQAEHTVLITDSGVEILT